MGKAKTIFMALTMDDMSPVPGNLKIENFNNDK